MVIKKHKVYWVLVNESDNLLSSRINHSSDFFKFDPDRQILMGTFFLSHCKLINKMIIFLSSAYNISYIKNKFKR